MVKINGKEVEWEKAPNFVNDIQRKILWRDEETGASARAHFGVDVSFVVFDELL